MAKTKVQEACELRAKTHPCPKCGKGNKKNGMFLSACQYCGASIDGSYLFAPWSLTWEELQASHDRFDKLFRKFGK